MKKRVAAAVLGIMLSVSMGLEVPAAALDSGFESGFTSEQAADVQTEDGAEAVQPSEDTEKYTMLRLFQPYMADRWTRLKEARAELRGLAGC